MSIGVGVDEEFTTRPELRGTMGMVSSTHYVATAVGMRILELGGNAFDAAVAAGFVLQVVQPHLNGPGGDLPAIVWDARTGTADVLCAQGVAPLSANIDLFDSLGLGSIPGTGLLAPCVPGAMDGWLTMLRDRGTQSLRATLEPAISYARSGFIVSPEMTRTVASVEELFANHWPTSAELYLSNGRPPAAKSKFTNPALATFYETLINEAESVTGTREAQIDAARIAFYRGSVADEIDSFVRTSEVMDASGSSHRGVLTGDDLHRWCASWEEPIGKDFMSATVLKAGPWSQGPVLLQQLAILEGFDLAAMGAGSSDYVHSVVEAAKLAFADRAVWYGDPNFVDVPLTTLLSAEYATDRRALIGQMAQREVNAGRPDGRAIVESRHGGRAASSGAGVGEPTVPVQALPSDSPMKSVHAGDTCHVDVADRWGNMVSATPSGGWLQSSPTIPALGFALGTRLQMFELSADHLNGLAPGKRPRTTLSPTLALRDGEPWLAFGTPGGDQQDQWTLQFLLNVLVFGDDLQLAIDRPVFQTAHFPSSFFPHDAIARRVYMESRFDERVIADLKRRGHDVHLTRPWSLTRLCAVGRDRDGTLLAAANPRGMEGYAIGR